jgi:hypothetical protein
VVETGERDLRIRFGNTVPSAAKAGTCFLSFTYGLKPVPFKNRSFSARAGKGGLALVASGLHPATGATSEAQE